MTEIKYAVDSQGKVHSINKELEISSVISIKKRIEFLWQMTSKFIPVFKRNGVDVEAEHQKESFDYFLQPFGVHEYIVCFIKTKVASTSNEVKLAYIMRKDPNKARVLKTNIANGLKTDYSDDMLMSIMPCSKKSNDWWLINTLVIKIERNKYDGKIINIELESITPYYRFTNLFKNNIFKIKDGKIEKSTEQTDNYYAFNPLKKDFKNKLEVLNRAVVFENIESNYKKLDEEITKIFLPFKEKLDIYSNIRANYINSIVCNPLKNIFPIYDDLKKYLKEQYDDIKSVKYNGNCISFYLKKYGKQQIYVCRFYDNDLEHDVFIINGHSYTTLDELKNALIHAETSKCFSPNPSFVKDGINIIDFYFKERNAET